MHQFMLMRSARIPLNIFCDTMTHTTTPEKIRTEALTLSLILALKGSPIGVKIVQAPGAHPFAGDQTPMRFCQALMRARHGEKSLITGENITCPAAARAFGFKPLPEPLQTGKGLVGFGIVSDEKVAQHMFEGMTTLPLDSVRQLKIFPLDSADEVPDIIIIEDEPERLMWIALSYLHAHGGKRVQGSTAILQATCVDSCIIPFLENRLNYGLGCYGCRDATDMGSGEAIIGFPADDLAAMVSHLEYLAKKALPHSREKHAFGAFTKDHAGTGCDSL
ncbi:MAG: hypothetical protein BWY45_01838 [Euryarchaeota archaeon ADurb.Bin294]|nr:MAG: hypothetical protein BWY45_01838 [Euryarchaeota archaeon ADurb.Bin294]